MSDSSLPVGSFCENNDLELGLEDFFNNLRIATNSKKSNEMSLPVLDIKNLSIIPQFDGNCNKLHRFISAAESILTHYYDQANPNSFQNTLLLNGILNKLDGRAEEVVAIYGAKSWEDIKNTLIQNFGDQRDENCLNQDLVNLRQKPNETPFQFHEKVMHLLNAICNYIDLHSNRAERDSKRDFFTKQALKTFLAGLRDPLGPAIRAMRPTTLAQALHFITEEENIKYYQRYQSINQFNVVKKPPMQNPQPSHYFPQNHFNRFPQQFQPRQMLVQPRPQSQFPQGPINIQRHFNPPVQRFPTNSQVFGKPQNVWRPTSNVPQNKPTPMSTSTRNTTPQYKRPYQNNAFGNNSQNPNVPEQLYNAEHFDDTQTDNDVEYYDEHHDEQAYGYTDSNDERSENFHEDLNPNEET